MGETLKNNKTSVKKGNKLNDEDILNDILISMKHLVSSYAIGLNEASNKKVYKLYNTVLNNSSKLQANLFDLSFKKGWYTIETADNKKINNTFNKFNKCLSDIDNQKKASN